MAREGERERERWETYRSLQLRLLVSRAAIITSHLLVCVSTLRERLLFKGAYYSRVATI